MVVKSGGDIRLWSFKQQGQRCLKIVRCEAANLYNFDSDFISAENIITNYDGVPNLYLYLLLTWPAVPSIGWPVQARDNQCQASLIIAKLVLIIAKLVLVIVKLG